MPNLNSKLLQNFYKTSPMREGILSWYPFEKGALILESADGVLTDLLRSHSNNVVSFERGYSGSEKFDYVVVIDLNEITVELLKEYRLLLTKHGRLLLAFENPYGLQYFAGKHNSRTNIPFDFKRGESKKEVEIRLKLAGFEGQKWYYPFTNHYFAKEVYSQNYLPNEFFSHRSLVLVEDVDTKIFDERELWADVIKGGAFEFLCNSYLVEARVNKTDKECDVDFAAITAYREPSKALITTIHSDGTAKKRAVFEEGIARLKSLAVNHNELANLGVSVLQAEFKDDYITMKRLELPILWDYWCKKLTEGCLEEDELFRHYDKIREEIKKSVKHGRCYWELVPANCFYDVSNDKIIFFDQEFYWEDIDTDLAMVRAICALTYASEFRSYYKTEDWLKKLKSRYGLIDKWDELERIASSKTYEYVFNPTNTEPLEKSSEQVVQHMWELQGERISARNRYKKMNTVAAIINDMGIGNVAIYGYGLRGKMLRYALSEQGVNVTCIIDRASPLICGIPLFRTMEEVPEGLITDLIVVTPFDGSVQIATEIKSKVHFKVATLEEIING